MFRNIAQIKLIQLLPGGDTFLIPASELVVLIQHYLELGWPAIQKGGFDAKLVGYFTSDAGTLNQLVHLWKFDDDADRRNHWATLSADEGFRDFVAHLRPLLMKQENKLLLETPWGPHP